MQKARRHSLMLLRPLVSARFQVLLHSAVRGTGPLSVSQEYLALADGTAGFRQDFPGPALLRIRLRSNSFSNTRLSRSTAGLSRPFF